MERIAVVGLSWREGGPEHLARLALEPERVAESLPALAADLRARELCYLATCNRVEVAFRGDQPAAAALAAGARRRVFEALVGRPAAPGEAERTLRAWAGEGAAEHLFLVAAGLDSARVGEGEIGGQLTAAVARSRELGLLAGRLSEVLEEALRVARRVRRRASLDLGRTSLAEIALEEVDERLALGSGTVALVGVSAMTERCARSLAARGLPLLVVNRGRERALEFAARLPRGTRTALLADFAADPEPLAAIVSATGAREPILDGAALGRLARAAGGPPPLWVDLGVPPDVDPGTARAAGLRHVGLGEVLARAERTRGERLERSAEARVSIDRALDALRARLGGRTVDALVVALRADYAAAVESALERALRRELAGLDARQRDALRELGARLAARFAHVPTKGLRELARHLGPEAIEAFLAGTDGALLRAAREAARADGTFAALEATRRLEREDGP